MSAKRERGRGGEEREMRECHRQSLLPYPHLDGMAIGKGIQAHSTGMLLAEEVGPDLILWVGVVYTEVLYPGGKALVEPEVSPPLHRHLRPGDTHMTATQC